MGQAQKKLLCEKSGKSGQRYFYQSYLAAVTSSASPTSDEGA